MNAPLSMSHTLRAVAAALALVFVACTDNALHFRTQVERAVARLERTSAAGSELVVYVPVENATRPYWLVLLPNRRTSAAELVRRGMPSLEAHQLFGQLEYVDIDAGNLVIVWQEGEHIAFQGYHGATPVHVADPIVVRARGATTLVLRRSEGGEYHLTLPE